MLLFGKVEQVFKQENVNAHSGEKLFLEFILLEAAGSSEIKFDIYDEKAKIFLEKVNINDFVIVDFFIKSKKNQKTGKYYNNLIVNCVYDVADESTKLFDAMKRDEACFTKII